MAHIRALRPNSPIVAVADAAQDSRIDLESLEPNVQGVDYWHACQHLKTVADHATDTDCSETHRDLLIEHPDGGGRVIALIGTLLKTASSSHADLERELAFFKRNRHRMDYRELQSRTLIVGSGTVEAANQVPVTQRMKRSEMRWKVDGGQGILSIRALLKSGRFNVVWYEVLNSMTARNDNVSY